MTDHTHDPLQLLSPYLDAKYQELVRTQASLQEDKHLSEQAKQLVPQAEDKIREITEWYQKVCAARKAAMLKNMEVESKQTAKSLDPLDNMDAPWAQTKQGAWTVLGGMALGSLVVGAYGAWAVGPAGVLATPMVWAGIAAMYKSYLGKAEAAHVETKMATPSKQLDAIAQYEIVLMQFAPGKTGNFTYNYNCTFVAQGGTRDIMQIWQLSSEKYGNLYGATFVAFRNKSEDAEIALLIKLDDENHNMECIELRPGFLHSLRYVKKDLLAYLSKNGADVIQTLTPLTQAIADYDGKTKREQDVAEAITELNTQIAHIRKIGVEPKTLDEMLLQIDLFRQGKAVAPRGMLLYGPSGTGKTKIGQTIAQATRCGYIKVDVAELKMGGKGTVAEKVKRLWRRAFLQAPCILFLDDCDTVLGGDTSVLDKGSPERELADTFLAEWDAYQQEPGKVLVLGATNRRDAIDMSVFLRFNQALEIGLPSEPVRRRILVQEFESAGIVTPVLPGMVKATAGMAGRDLQQLAMRVKGLSNGQMVNDALFADALKSIRSKASTQTETVAWIDVVLPTEVKSKLQYLTKKIKKSEEYVKMGLPVSKSLLLYGPPGTGKTQIARALATESGLSFMALSTSDIKGSKPGESGKRVQAMFERARSQSPCLLFVDEIDIVARARAEGDLIGEEIVGQFLQEMDGINSRASIGQVFVIGATNHKEQIDEAILSRFSDQEEIALPTTKGRIAILWLHLRGKPVAFDISETVPLVAKATEGFSGRDLKSLVQAAASRAMQRADKAQLDIQDIRIEESDFEGLVIGGKTVTFMQEH